MLKKSLSICLVFTLTTLAAGPVLSQTITPRIYWSDVQENKIYSAKADGTETKVVLALDGRRNFDDPNFLFCDETNHKLYWSDSAAGTLRRVDMTGQNVEDLFTLDDCIVEGLGADVSNGKLYWLDICRNARSLRSAGLDGSGLQTLTSSSVIIPAELTLDPTTQKIYWIDSTVRKVQRINFDGSNQQTLLDTTAGQTSARGVVVDISNQKLLYTDDGKIIRVDVNGGGAEDVLNNPAYTPYFIALDPGAQRVYWADSDHAAIGYVDIGNPAGAAILFTAEQATDLCIDTGLQKIFWSNEPRNIIYSANFDGSGKTVLLRKGPYVTDLSLDPDTRTLFFTDQGRGLIQKTRIGTGTAETLVSNDDSGPIAINLDSASSRIFWADQYLGTLNHAALDGSAQTAVLSGLANPGSLAIDPAGNNLFFASLDYSERAIKRAALDGSGVSDLLTPSSEVVSLAFAGGTDLLYYIANFSSAIARTDLSGSSITLYSAESSSPDFHRLAMDAAGGGLYWTWYDSQHGLAKIVRSDLDGNNLQNVVAGLGHPYGLAVGVDPYDACAIEDYAAIKSSISAAAVVQLAAVTQAAKKNKKAAKQLGCTALKQKKLKSFKLQAEAEASALTAANGTLPNSSYLCSPTPPSGCSTASLADAKAGISASSAKLFKALKKSLGSCGRQLKAGKKLAAEALARRNYINNLAESLRDSVLTCE